MRIYLKYKKLNKFLIFLFGMIVSSFILNFNGCSSSSVPQNNGMLNIAVKPTLINAWINLMPGKSDPNFHVIGEIEVQNISTYAIKNLTINNVEVLQDGEEIYSFTPTFSVENLDISADFLPNEFRLYTFGNKEKLEFNNKLNLNKSISVVVEFYASGEAYYEKIDSINVSKVY